MSRNQYRTLFCCLLAPSLGPDQGSQGQASESLWPGASAHKGQITVLTITVLTDLSDSASAHSATASN